MAKTKIENILFEDGVLLITTMCLCGGRHISTYAFSREETKLIKDILTK